MGEGEEIGVYKLEREYEENYFVDMRQRVDFPRVYYEPRCSLLLLKGECPLVEDMVSSSWSLNFSVVPGRARRCFYDLVPSAWDGRQSVKWSYDERYFERELYFDLSLIHI